MGTIKDKVAIIGMGCTKYGELWNKSVNDLIIDATFEACEDAGVELKDVEAAWLGTVFSGHTAISLSPPLKLQYIPVTRVENMCATGTEALRAAAYAVAAGACDIALAVGVEKLKDTGLTGVQPTNVIGRSTMGTTGTEMEMSPPAMFSQRLSFGLHPPSSGAVIFVSSSFDTTSMSRFHSRGMADINSDLFPGTHSSSSDMFRLFPYGTIGSPTISLIHTETFPKSLS